MNKGLKLDFIDGKVSLNINETVDGYVSVIQSISMAIATTKGSDKIYPDKGTVIFESALKGKLVDEQSAQHESTFAGLQTLFFLQRVKTDSTKSISDLSLVSQILSGQMLDIKGNVIFADGDELNLELALAAEST